MARRRVLPVVAAVLLLAGCTGAPASESASSPSAPTTTAGSSPASSSPAAPMDLSLLVFNVEYGGSKVTDAVMKDIDADVVSVLESYDRLPAMAEAAGYPYYDYGLQILSKYPILEPSGADGLYAWIEVRPGEAVALINTHLDYVKDGPRRLQAGVPIPTVIATENEVRTSSIDKLLPSARTLLADGWPVLLTGDLNEPSHLDWTDATASQHDGIGAVAWPVSEAILAAGLQDVYRTANPDPVGDPGNTWGDVNGKSRMPVRIDYAYAGGPVEIRSSEVVGEQGAAVVDRGYPKWTSDHRAVYSMLQVTPAPIPTSVALSSRMLTVGDTVTVTYRLPPGAASGQVTISGPQQQSFSAAGDAGTIEVATHGYASGSYDVVLQDAAGAEVARNEMYVRPADATVRLTTDASTYDVGAPITVSWVDGPANRWDWIGVYEAGASNPEKDDYLVWGYTGGHDAGALPPTTEGSLVLGRDHQGRPWPLPAGKYVVHYLLSDEYTSAGSASFTVRG